jgi:hypothetical protein
MGLKPKAHHIAFCSPRQQLEHVYTLYKLQNNISRYTHYLLLFLHVQPQTIPQKHVWPYAIKWLDTNVYKVNRMPISFTDTSMQISNILVHNLFQTHFVFQIFPSLFQTSISCMCKWTPLICPGFWNHYNLACFLKSNSSSDHYHKKLQPNILYCKFSLQTLCGCHVGVISGGKSYIMLVTWHSYQVSSVSVHCIMSQTNWWQDEQVIFHFIPFIAVCITLPGIWYTLL